MPYREFYEKICTTYTLMYSAFTVATVEVFLCPAMQIYLDLYARQRDRYHTLKIGGIAL